MAVLSSMPSRAVIDGLRGAIDFYERYGIAIARSWPKQKLKERAAGVTAAQQVFAYGHQMSVTLPAEVVESWQFLANQSNLTWRDWLARAYVGGSLTAPGQPPL